LDVAFCPLRFQVSGNPEDWEIRAIRIDGRIQPKNPREGAWVRPGEVLSMDVAYVGTKPEGEPFSCVASGVIQGPDPDHAPNARRAIDKIVSQEYAWKKVAKEEEARWRAAIASDPMYATHDGVALRELLARDEVYRRERAVRVPFTRAQRDAISAHWSALLRAKVADAARVERDRVRVDLDVDE
jgi:hypothetical protein